MTTREMNYSLFTFTFHLMKGLKQNNFTLTSLFLDLVLLSLRFFPLTPVLAALPFLPIAEDVFLLLTFLRFPV